MNDHQNPSRAIRQRAKELRQPLTPPEVRLWRILRDRRLGGFKFRRQHPIGRFIVDFYCMQVCLVVELDGPTHEDQVEYDEVRTEWLQAQGHHVIRFSNQQVIQSEGDVARAILAKCQELMQTLTPGPSPATGEGGLLSSLSLGERARVRGFKEKYGKSKGKW